MHIESFSFDSKKQNRLAKSSAYSSGIGWALTFGFLFSDRILGVLSSGSNQGLAICAAPLFIISIFGFLLGIIGGYVAKYQIRRSGEEGIENARNAIRYGLFGLGFIIISPIINPLLEKTGIQLITYLDFFKGL